MDLGELDLGQGDQLRGEVVMVYPREVTNGTDKQMEWRLFLRWNLRI